jgi:hypothetical protein
VASVPPQKIKPKKGVLQGPKKWLATTETALLEAEFLKKSTKWQWDHVQDLAAQMGISSTKIYKWNYDRKKKSAVQARLGRPANALGINK